MQKFREEELEHLNAQLKEEMEENSKQMLVINEDELW